MNPQYPSPSARPPFGAPAPATRSGWRQWAVLVVVAAALVGVFLLVLAEAGAYRERPRYTGAQAVAHVHAAAFTAVVRNTSDARITSGLRQVCAALDDGSTTVAADLQSGNGLDLDQTRDVGMILTTAIGTYCPRHFAELRRYAADHH